MTTQFWSHPATARGRPYDDHPFSVLHDQHLIGYDVMLAHTARAVTRKFANILFNSRGCPVLYRAR